MRSVTKPATCRASVFVLSALMVLAGMIRVAPAAAAAPTAEAQAEIAQLLEFLETSGCSFNRNGAWYDPPKAAAHLRDKLRMLSFYGQIGTVADFIDKAATASSVSGQAYEVRCGTSPAIASRQWLYEALARLRACGGHCSRAAPAVPASALPPAD